MSTWKALASGGTLAGLLFTPPTPGRAQEAVLMSSAETAVETTQNTVASTPDYYNLKWGPTLWHLGAGLSVQYNDNVSLADSNPEGDFIIIPQLNAGMVWPLSQTNTLNLSLALGYTTYLRNSGLDQLYVAPGSQLSLGLEIGEFKINFHERFSISQYAYQDPTVSGTGDYAQLQNIVGATVTRDWDNASAQLGYDHANYDPLTGVQGLGKGQSDSLSTSAAYKFWPGLSLGPEAGAALFQHEGTETNQGNEYQWNVGAALKAQISEHLEFDGSAGYMVSLSEQGNLGGQSSRSPGFYAVLSLTHHVNQYLDYVLSGGRSESSSFFGGSFSTDQANLVANWHLVRQFSLSTFFGFQHGSQVFAGSETFDQFNAGVNLARQLNRRLSGSLGYQVYRHASNQPGQGYTANIISLNLNYTF